MGTALVVGLLVVMGGGIAYVGDTLGWRMGKRRLSLLGLRPRHTAAVFTVATGILIASVTLGVLMLASRGVRIAVTRGEQLLHDNHRLKQERHALEALGRRLSLQTSALQRANGELSLRNQMLRGEENRLHAETGRLQQRSGALQSKNTVLTQRNEHLLQEDRRLSARNTALTGENRHLLRANSELDGTNRTLESSNTRLQARNRGLQTAKAGLERARDRAQAQLTKLQGSLIRTQADLTQAQANLKQVQDSALRVAESLRPMSERGRTLANGIVVVRAGEELARRVIPPGESVDAVRGALQALLRDAQAEVDRRVSRLHGPARPIRLNPRDEAPDRLTEQTVMALMTESHPINGRIPTMPVPEIHPLVVRALASQNEAAESGDPVEVDIGGQVNHLAFRRGEEVASLPLNTASTSGQILENLVSFLQGPVRQTAIDHSILPDATGSVGKIEYEPLLEVVNKVKHMPGQVRVGAVVKADTWTAGPLRLDFYVVPADTRVAADRKPK